MAHLHTGPGGHDVTVSALVLRQADGAWRLLVHRHRRSGLTLQPGGHVEHDENVWQALAHELAEESGYTLAELAVLQPLPTPVGPVGPDLPLPVPYGISVHEMYPGHLHNDLKYAFVAEAPPRTGVAEGESQDLWWASADELDADPLAPELLARSVRTLVADVLPTWHRIPADRFPLGDPPAREA